MQEESHNDGSPKRDSRESHNTSWVNNVHNPKKKYNNANHYFNCLLGEKSEINAKTLLKCNICFGDMELAIHRRQLTPRAEGFLWKNIPSREVTAGAEPVWVPFCWTCPCCG